MAQNLPPGGNKGFHQSYQANFPRGRGGQGQNRGNDAAGRFSNYGFKNSSKNNEETNTGSPKNSTENVSSWRASSASFKRHPNYELDAKSSGSQDFVLGSADGPPLRQQDRNVEKKNFGPGFKHLESLCELNPEQIIISISTNKYFSNRLDQDLAGDYVVIMLKLLSKVCQSSFKALKAGVITLFCKERFIDNLKKFIALLAVHNEKDKHWNQYFWRNPEEFWSNMHVLCNSVIELMPSTAIDIMPHLISSANLSIRNLETEQKITIPQEIKRGFEKLQQKLIVCAEENEKQRKKTLTDAFEIEPPDNFLHIDVYPTSKEILSPGRSFVRENKIDRQYGSVKEYLDIQYRLLREDFMGPLREGIGEYLKQRKGETEKKKIHAIRVHPKVQFVRPEYLEAGVGTCVQFEFNLKKLAKEFSSLTQDSKRFMHGSLVCFTKDNFKTLTFTKIIGRDIKLLKRGLIVVDLFWGHNIEVGVDYIMVECNVYFEPYYHVLHALQNMYEYGLDEMFPMERYIIKIDADIRPPQYLRNDSHYCIDGYNIELFNASSWPSAEALRLNDTQFEAFKTGLTKEFCVIQGPPGTGKTHVGLKIVKTLIENYKIWYNNTPILIVCYTNHALHQFLEGLLFTTSRIIRVGGQSKSAKLELFSIKNKRKDIKKINELLGYNLSFTKKRLYYFKNSISIATARIDSINQFNSILHFSNFDFLDDESWFATAETEEIEEWLFESVSMEERNAGRTMRMNELEQMEKMKMDEDNKSEQDEFVDIDIEQDIIKEITLNMDDDERPVDRMQYLLKVENLEAELKKKRQQLNTLVVEDDETAAESYKLNDECCHIQDRLDYLQQMLEIGKSRFWQRPAGIDLAHPHNMKPEARWQLYFHWLYRYRNHLKAALIDDTEKFFDVSQRYSELRDMADVEIMQRMLVVGMTTTSAARVQSTYNTLRSQIVIVEEAAEVLESHIVTSLSPSCKHLILIGDHQQLRPSTADYYIETKMKLGISFFERMVKNKIHCSVLGVQHRMRPEISRLIRPAIYPHLTDHKSVLTFPPIGGIDHSLYFIHHTHSEVEAGSSSKQNEHEAKYLVRLAKHLILNGYKPENITILAAYLGQYYMIVKEMQNYIARLKPGSTARLGHEFNPRDYRCERTINLCTTHLSNLLNNVQIAVLDNYQGEENQIILLSLVRNNNENSIGFLKIENRVCVALSRAKEGMYIMGNMDLLIANSQIWPKIKEVLVDQNSLGEYLTLRCEIHQNHLTKVKNIKDFDKCPEGGCNEICGRVISCGHTCRAVCHIIDPNHETLYYCKEKCVRLLCKDPSHICAKYCYEDCGPCWHKVLRVLNCGHEHMLKCHIDPKLYKGCITPILSTLECGHKVEKPCYLSPEDFACPSLCETVLECGHCCSRICHFRKGPNYLEKCEPCTVQVRKQRKGCNHFQEVSCSQNVDKFICEKPCEKTLPCKHPCKKQCYRACGDCTFTVYKKVEFCGHIVQVACNTTPNRSVCNGKCPLKLSCGHPCGKRCCEGCTSVCVVLVDSPVQSVCGHRIQIPCYLSCKGLRADDYNLLKFCRQPCNALLQCKHQCSGTCAECNQGRVHKACGSVCNVVLICGHECTNPCRQTCQPCSKPCEYRCKHKRCPEKCGQFCSPCEEPCPRVCQHIKCSAKCGDKCTVPPCTEPCPEKLVCGHECMGFCSDPCPQICRQCNKGELEEILSGFETPEDFKLVLLVDCGHVIESRRMDMWLNQTGKEDERRIKVKGCLKCTATLASTPRYSDYIKEAITNIRNINIKLYRMQRDNDVKKARLKNQAAIILENCPNDFLQYSMKLNTALVNIGKRLSQTKIRKRQAINKTLTTVLASKLELLQSLIDIFKRTKFVDSENRKKTLIQLEFIVESITRYEDRLTKQEISDIQNEMVRFTRMMQLLQVIEDPKFTTVKDDDNMIDLYENIKAEIFGIELFTEDVDKKVQSMLTVLNEEIETNVVIKKPEKKKIIDSPGLDAGRWFKCVDGHYYVSGECGEAAQLPACDECDSNSKVARGQ